MTDIGIRDISVSFRDNKISNISLVQGDALTRGFDITFVNAKGETLPVDDDYIVELVAVNSKDKDTPYACRHEVVDDKYRVMIPPEALSESGSVTIQLVFYQKSTKAIIHTIKQKCPVYQSIGQEFVESNNLYVDITALRLGLEKIEKLNNKYEEIIEKDVEIQNNETIRKEAENKRNLEEVIRQDNEVIRKSNEVKREQLKTALVGLKNRIESDLESINLTVDDIISSEDDRKQNEIIREEIKVELENLVADIQNKLDSGDFVGEKGEQGIQGEQGPQGPPGEVSQEEFDNFKDANSLKTAKLEKELQNYKSTMANINVNQEVKQSVSGYGSVSLPKNTANGQVSVSVKGNTVADENGTKSTISASRLKSVGKNLLRLTDNIYTYIQGGKTRSQAIKNHDIVVGLASTDYIQPATMLDYDLQQGYFRFRANPSVPGYGVGIKSIVKEGQYISVECTTIKGSPSMGVTFANASGNYISNVSVKNNIIVPQGSKYALFCITGKIDEEIEVNNARLCIGSTATPYEPYTESTAYLPNVGELRSLPNGVCDEIKVSGGKAELVKRVGDTMEELAEPITTPIKVSGTLLSNPSGTVYVENVVADAGVYDSGINVLDQGLPIDYVEKLSKVDFTTGLEMELDISKVVISEDEKSFTHPNLVDGDIIFFTYFHNIEGTEGELSMEYYDSRHVLKDTVTGKFYKIVQTVTDGVLTDTLVEV